MARRILGAAIASRVGTGRPGATDRAGDACSPSSLLQFFGIHDAAFFARAKIWHVARIDIGVGQARLNAGRCAVDPFRVVAAYDQTRAAKRAQSIEILRGPANDCGVLRRMGLWRGGGLCKRACAMSIAILTYHSLDDSGSVISVAPKVFAEQMQSLAQSGKRVVKLDDLPHLLELGESAVAITFDDGFRNFLEHAAPVLAQYKFPATVFLVTAHCGRDNGWPTQPKDVALQPLLTWDEVKTLHAAGIQFGAHSQSHHILTHLPPDDAEAEMVGSKRAIEAALGGSVESFAYPYGACNTHTCTIARRHFRVACGVQLGFAARNSDRMELERLDMYYWRNQPDLSDLFSWRTRAYVGVRAKMRAVRRLLSPQSESAPYQHGKS